MRIHTNLNTHLIHNCYDVKVNTEVKLIKTSTKEASIRNL